MPLLRLVRDRTRSEATAFDVIQGGAVVMTVIVQEQALASSPSLRWSVSFAIGSGARKRTITGLATSVEAAFFEAANQLSKARPRAGLPDFTVEEWVVLKDELRRRGVL